jgi:hypothetical protein
MLPTWFDNLCAALTQAVAARKAIIHLAIAEIASAAIGEALGQISSPGATLHWPAIWHAMSVAALIWLRAYFTNPTPPAPPIVKP